MPATSSSDRPRHNIPLGRVTACQVCGSPELHEVLDLGCQPLCDSLLTAEQLSEPETFYPLRQMWCSNCTLSQLDYVVPGDVVYHNSYPYRTGVTRELVEYQEQLAASIISQLRLPEDSLVVDIGCNDATLLQHFRNSSMRVVGVEPTNIAEYATAAGVDVLNCFFDREAARQIVESHGHARVVTATNVFAHMASIGDVIDGLETLVADDGYFVLENHYLVPVMERMQFDTIYHEHLRTYSLKSLVTLFGYYDFQVVRAEKVSRYGGNIRVYVAKGKHRTPDATVSEILAEEEKTLTNPSYYERFRRESIRLKNELLKFLIAEADRGHPVIGNSCPGRCSTLLNFAGVGPDLMPFLCEQPTSLKLGLYLPGQHLPIVNNQRLIEEQPESVLLLAWHYAEPIARQLRERGLRSKLYVPMPSLQRLDI
ncbi:class I SAM-dependent methyltransferase [Roseiconus nitratireducens]|uniref:Class I SAM-dependent methyltransferase n=1 Tax=Roseiconus nitratireducens TaxID=2605748 RepID=A0A5M6D497_9BACT|nr:class I SAM-dependent methyltransferase [Roseiconus nitratireducens]KAA5542163.1 class I SAM-dependent methyltransferase [Roseiconus nitratireducens]